MPETWIVDMTHYLLPDGSLAPGPAGRIANYFGSIASAASVHSPGAWVDTAIQCRRRPKRSRCQGHVRLRRSDAPSRVEWRCTTCGDNGLISNWKRTRWDLGTSREQTTSESLVQVRVSEEEMQVLRDILFFSAESQAMVDGALNAANGFLLRGSLDDFADLAGYVASEAGHEPDLMREELLDAVLERIETVVSEYGEDL